MKHGNRSFVGTGRTREYYRDRHRTPVITVSSPIVFCTTCGTVLAVKMDGRGFPPDIAKRRLTKACKNVRDHEAVVEYRAGMSEDLLDLLEDMRNKNDNF